MIEKAIEIHYDVKDVPDITGESEFGLEAIDFGNAAMELIEDALITQKLGKWVGASIDAGQLNFGFMVKDVDRAKATVYKAVRGTRFDSIREITRKDISRND